jgi:Ni/Co efflux regulator RcnB
MQGVQARFSLGSASPAHEVSGSKIMIRKLTAVLAAAAFALTALAPAAVDARDRRGGYYERDYRDWDRGRRHYRHHRHHDDHGDAVAAGVVGLVVGLALGSLASQPSEPRCYDNYRRCDRYAPQGYDRGYDPYYDDGRSAYEEDYGDYGPPPPPERTCRERQWDRYARRYVTVDVPC